MLNAQRRKWEIAIEAGRWLLLPVWLPALLITYVTGLIVVACVPKAVWHWLSDIWV